MIFTPYTQPVNPAEFVGTVDLNVYAKGLANQQQMYEQNLKSLTDDFSKLFNRNAYGPDKERLKALENQLREEVGSINLSDLTDMGTSSKIRNLVRSYGSDPQMQAIFKRTSIYESELEKQQTAMEKGEKWSSPALTTLNSYFNQDNFYEKPKGVNLTSGWYSYNDAKALKAAKDIVEKKKGYIEKANGEREEYEIIDPSDMLAALKTIQSSDPTYEQDMKWQFEQQYGDTDWQDYANQGNATMVQSAEATMEQARRIYNDPASTTQEKANAFENYTNAKKIADIYSDVYDTPESVEQTRENAYNDFKNRRVNRAISAVDAEQRKPAAMNEIKKMNYQQGLDISKMDRTKMLELQIESGLDPDAAKYRDENGGFKRNLYIQDAATIVQENKKRNAKAASGVNDPSDRAINYADWTRDKVIKDATTDEQTEWESSVKRNINAFKNLGFENINSVDYVTVNDDGTYTVNFDRKNFLNNVVAPFGTADADEVILTADQLADILDFGLGRKKREDVNKNLYDASDSDTPPEVEDSSNNNTVEPVTDSLANKGNPRGRNPR